MFVATATRGSIPNRNIAGTVIRELLPVTTPTTLVTKKRSIKATSGTERNEKKRWKEKERRAEEWNDETTRADGL
jgi:hypothetical protein